MYYLVVDLEATCTGKEDFREHMETIEIGSVLCDEKFYPIKEFTTFIKPNKFPILSEFCKKLTTITQYDVDNAPYFPVAIETFKREMLYSVPELTMKEVLFCSWGDYDRLQFMKDYEYWGLEYDLPRHINLKTEFSFVQGLRKNKRLGMKKALELCNLRLDGTHHRGIDDAKNISKLLPYIFSDKRIRR